MFSAFSQVDSRLIIFSKHLHGLTESLLLFKRKGKVLSTVFN